MDSNFISAFFMVLVPLGAMLFFSYIYFSIWPDYQAKRELFLYWENHKETFVYDGGFMFDHEFRGVDHYIMVTTPKPKQPFKEAVKGRIMIKNREGKYFFLDYNKVPQYIRSFWEQCIEKSNSVNNV